MRVVNSSAAALCCAAVFVSGCAERPVPEVVPTSTGVSPAVNKSGAGRVVINPGPDAPKKAQAAMINAKPGDTIEFARAGSSSARRSRSTSAA